MVAYPRELERLARLADGGEVTIRPIRPEDAPLEQEFVQGLSAESRYFRFLDTIKQLTPKMLRHFTEIDYDRHMALIAVAKQDGREIEVGVARYITTRTADTCEFALVVADAWQRRGLGRILMEALIQVARARGLRLMFGDVLASNGAMLGLMRRLGFCVERSPDDPMLRRVLFRLRRPDGVEPAPVGA